MKRRIKNVASLFFCALRTAVNGMLVFCSVMFSSSRNEKYFYINDLVGFIIYGNYFYGICAVALAIEAGLQQHIVLNNWAFYVLLFIATVLYYTHAYTINVSSKATNP